MEGKGPYRIYDPGGSEVRARDEAGGGSSYRQLLEENSILRERMKGLKSLGGSPKEISCFNSQRFPLSCFTYTQSFCYFKVRNIKQKTVFHLNFALTVLGQF